VNQPPFVARTATTPRRGDVGGIRNEGALAIIDSTIGATGSNGGTTQTHVPIAGRHDEGVRMTLTTPTQVLSCFTLAVFFPVSRSESAPNVAYYLRRQP